MPVAGLNRFRVLILLVVGVAAISSAAVLIRLADAPPLVAASCRLVIASIVLLPFALPKLKRAIMRWSAADKWLMLLAGGAVALHFWLWITSLSYTSIASSVVLVTSHPAFVALLSYVLWRERLNRLGIAGIMLALFGVIVINSGHLAFGVETILGNAMALLAAVAMGIYLLIGRHLRARIDALSYLAVVYTLAAILLVAAALATGDSLWGYSADTYWMLLLLGLVPQLVGHTSLNLAVRRVPATLVSVAILGEPVGATLLGWGILGEAPGLNELLGGLAILGGILLVVIRGNVSADEIEEAAV